MTDPIAIERQTMTDIADAIRYATEPLSASPLVYGTITKVVDSGGALVAKLSY